VSVLPYLLAAWLFLVGFYGVVTSRHLVHLAVCLTVMQSSTYVLLLSIGFVHKGATAPVFKGVGLNTKAVDPVVQALTLTDVVVSVVMLALVLALAMQAHHRSGTVNPDELHPIEG
jgi:multicomponent Na+:H+ antiporter subunit C